MPKFKDSAKDTLRSILQKVEKGNATIEEIKTAQAIVESSWISRHSLLKVRPYRIGGRPKGALVGQLLQNDDYYTVQEVAERFKVSDKAVYKWIDQGKINYERSSESSRDIRIPKSQFKNPPSKA